MGMPVGELEVRMSAYELTVLWPAFFDARRLEQEQQAEKEKRLGS
jgi:hypothetical protein